jgi:hypothetical protein
VNVAAQLEQAAAPGKILIGAQTLGLVRDAVDAEPVAPLTLRGKSAAIPAHRLIAVRAGAAGHERRLDAPLVGRGRELRLLRDVFDRAVDERRSFLFTLLGAAGVGKSRLVREFLGAAGGEATVVRGRCLAYGEGITFYPLVEVLMQLGEPAEAVLARVTHGGAASAGELHFEVRPHGHAQPPGRRALRACIRAPGERQAGRGCRGVRSGHRDVRAQGRAGGGKPRSSPVRGRIGRRVAADDYGCRTRSNSSSMRTQWRSADGSS